MLISPLEKGLGVLDAGATSVEIAALGWNVLREDLSLPTAVLCRESMMHNLRWMQEFIGKYGAKLAPHGKTTMAPKLFAMQLKGGAWGITLATVQQVQVAHAHGVRRVLIANQLVGKANMAKVSRMIAGAGADGEFEFFCLVDSAQNVKQLGAYFRDAGQRLNVLIELGVAGGRAGVRDDGALQEVVEEIGRWRDSVALCGVEVYEGVLKEEKAVRELLARAVETMRTLAAQGAFARSPIILSGAGSAWYDVVAEVFSGAAGDAAMEVVLRPGCYLTHDVGIYREAQKKILERNPIAARMKNGLQPALQLWAYVQSVPEKGLAILGLGKRDAAFDAGLPQPVLHFRPGWERPAGVVGDWALTKMMDQHAYLAFPRDADVRVGDMIGCDISHPCLTFDKWRVLPVVDEDYNVVDVVGTYF